LIVVSNSTILIGLARINKLDLLKKLFSKVYIPDAVFNELTQVEKADASEIKKASYLIQKTPKDTKEVSLLLGNLDRSEAEVLALSKELNADLVLIDEEKARKVVVLAGFEVMGLMGVLLTGKRKGLLKSIKPLIEELKKKKFRVAEEIIADILKSAGE
jgi:predicted nucleic acid-binding protein